MILSRSTASQPWPGAGREFSRSCVCRPGRRIVFPELRLANTAAVNQPGAAPRADRLCNLAYPWLIEVVSANLALSDLRRRRQWFQCWSAMKHSLDPRQGIHESSQDALSPRRLPEGQRAASTDSWLLTPCPSGISRAVALAWSVSD